MDERIQTVRKKFASSSPALAAFDYLLAKADAAGFKLVPRTGEVRSVEFQCKDLRRISFSAQAHLNHINFYLRPPILKEHPGLFAAAERRYGPVIPNSLGEYRRHLSSRTDVDDMLQFLGEEGAWP